MKTKSMIFLAVFALTASSIFAQGNSNFKGQKGNPEFCENNGGHQFMNIPDLSDDQKGKIQDLRTAHMKEVLPLKNELKEKEAHLQTVSTGDNVDLNKVNAAIDEIGKIKTDLAKKRAAFKQEVRKILTEDQRVYFDMHSPKMNHQKNMTHKPHHMQR